VRIPALATGLAAPAYAEETDDIFVSVLDSEGISYPSAEEAVLVANGVCVYMSEGNSLEDAVSEVMKQTGLELEQRASLWAPRRLVLPRTRAIANPIISGRSLPE
jgi:hypothetical protein